MEPISFGQCSICGQGELLAMKLAGSKRMIVMCDDCESQWDSPEDAKSYNKALTTEVSGLILATSHDALEAGWNRLK